MTARIESFPTRSLRGAAQLQNPSFLISHMLMVSDTSILPVSSALVAAGVWLAGFPEALIFHSRCSMYLGCGMTFKIPITARNTPRLRKGLRVACLNCMPERREAEFVPQEALNL